MTIKPAPVFCEYNVQQFLQFNPEDVANWSLLECKKAKKGFAMFPALGRKHVNILGTNIFNFTSEPRAIYKSVKYAYVFVQNRVYRYDRNFNNIVIFPSDMSTTTGSIYFTYLVAPGYTLACFTDGYKMWVHNEATDSTVRVTDANLIEKPTALIAFGNRIAITGKDNNKMVLSKINLGPLSGDNINPATCFTLTGGQLSAYETEDIVNFCVLHNTLYVFLQSTTSIWSNIPSTFGTVDGVLVQFPWKKNTTYNFDYGLSSPFAFSTDFGRMVWLGQNQDGLNQVVLSDGSAPIPISTKAVDILLERDAVADEVSPFLAKDTVAFIYQYQNTVYFRLSAGKFYDFGTLDVEDTANSIEYNFDTKQWKRLIEVNGERNRIQDHIYFSNRHLVTVRGDSSVYEMSGQFFTNEVRNDDQDNVQADDAYIEQPMRYEMVTPIISEEDYGEFATDWLQIDFVWGDKTFVNSRGPYENAVYIVTEEGEYMTTEDGEYIVEENSNYPELDSTHYHYWFKPHVELYFSDDGGISYHSADVREFSQLGVYNWRMRWYELGPSRNRVYKLIVVSPSPIVILGAVMNTRRLSGNAA